MHRLSAAARGLPIADHLAPRLVREGTLDLTGATLFVTDLELHARIVDCAKEIGQQRIQCQFGALNLASAMTILLTSLHGLHSFWRKKETFSPNDLAMYHSQATRFGQIWHALGWKVSTWVHWTVVHSCALANHHRNFYLFSSIPTERRNVEFKLDVTHCFKGWKQAFAGCPFLPVHSCYLPKFTFPVIPGVN